jgi:hypothetical protein
MKILYMCVFFGDMLVICGLAFRLFEGIDVGMPVWVVMVLGIALGLAITLLILLILYYLERGSGR